MIQFLNYKKSYGLTPALQIPNMKLEKGIYWVKGVNGSGKSTLLKSMAGMLGFDGDILLNDNISIKKNPTIYRKHVNFSEAEPMFPQFITGMEMIDLFAGAKNAKDTQKDDLISGMKIGHYVDQPIGSYSSGMLKKLSLVIAFLGAPKIILLDEPLITIDAESFNIINSWIAQEYRLRGTTFFLSSHQAIDLDLLPEAKELIVNQQTLKVNE